MSLFDSVILCLILCALVYHATHCDKCNYKNTRCKLCDYAKKHTDETRKVLKYFNKEEKEN